MRSKIIILFCLLAGCADTTPPGGGGSAQPKPVLAHPALDAKLKAAPAREIECSLAGRSVKLALPESGGRVADYLPRLLLANAALWPTLPEIDGALIYNNCLRPELLALTEGEAP